MTPMNNATIKAPVFNKPKVMLPATDIPLHGHHLIEASAGTGKTWTLSGIVLRLLIEGKRPPEQMICSTFTRAAAAELRERIYERLLAFNHVLEWLWQLLSQPIHQQALFADMHDNKADEYEQQDNINSLSKNELKTNTTTATIKQNNENQEKIKAYLLKQASQSGIKELEDRLSDKVNLHLLAYLIEHHRTYPITEAMRRTRHLLTSLDKLFVSTLDSLAQKWLSEFASETGHTSHISISDSQDEHINAIIHDHIRKFYTHLYHDDRATYQFLLQHQLYQVSDFRNAVEKGLNFLSAPIDKISEQKFDFKAYDQLISQILQTGWAELQPYFEAEYRKKQKMFANGKLSKNLPAVQELFTVLSEHPYDFVAHLSKEAEGFWEGFKEYATGEEDAAGKVKGFNNNSRAERQVFDALSIIQQLKQLVTEQNALTNYLETIRQRLIISTINEVREQLPKRLIEAGETTFSLQMQKLNHALLGKQGENLAKLIRHRYPIALIDESQDINSEQAMVIEQVYLSGKGSHRQGFLLLVGDPKQAIYGFRGGDVANYNQIKTHFANSTYSLVQNFRSTQSLVGALNHWFGQGQNVPPDDVNPLANLGDSIYYQHIQAYREQGKLHLPNVWQANDTDAKADTKPNSTPPVSIIHLPYEGNDSVKATAQHITQLLQSQPQLDGRAVKPSDIAVLAKSNKDLDSLQRQLANLGVMANKSASTNIFESVMAEELLAILQALQSPYNQSRINRTLVSQCRGMTLEQVKAWQSHKNNDKDNKKNSLSKFTHLTINNYEQYQQLLNTIAKSWQKKSTVAVLNSVLSLPIRLYNCEPELSTTNLLTNQTLSSTHAQNIWQTLSKQEDAERLLLDLRQLLEIIGEHTAKMGEFEVIDWLSTMIESPPEEEWSKSLPTASSDGVKLMTIHGSKGLEFPIVYVLGMTSSVKKSSDKFHLYAYVDVGSQNSQTNSLQPRHLSATPHRDVNKQDNHIADMELKEAFDELKRLFYVAMTRASEQLFVIVKDHFRKNNLNLRPLNHWLDCTDSKEYHLPERLQAHIGWIDSDVSVEQTPSTPHPLSPTSETNYLTAATNVAQPKLIDYPDYHSVIRQTHFMGWGRTSFTALSRLLDKSNNHSNITVNNNDNAIDAFDNDLINNAQSLKQDETDYQTVMVMEQKQSIKQKNRQDNPSYNNSIRFNFVKGANAGSFLHKVLEKLPTTKTNAKSAMIDKYLQEYELPKRYSSQWKNSANFGDKNGDESITNTTNTVNPTHQQLMSWLDCVMQTPFVASNVCLADLSPHQLKPEMSFNMGMNGKLNLGKLADTIAKHLSDEPDKHLQFTDDLSDNRFELRYLKGEIDLVYEHDGKFYVVDYKSNYLGNQFSYYEPDALKEAMGKAGYWLQAMIYQVALHRLLKMRLKNYIGNEPHYLGAVEYVFLRGFGVSGNLVHHDETTNHINGYDNDTANQTKTGSIHWDMPISLIHALDKLL